VGGVTVHDTGGLDLAGMGVVWRLHQSAPLLLGQFILGDHGNPQLRQFRQQLLAGILQRHPVGAAGMAGQHDHIAEALTVERTDQILQQAAQGGGGDGDGAGVLIGGAAVAVMDRRRHE